jgi:uncharacterized protein (TIGR01777 family)
MKKKIILAGGSGFLGESFADFLINKGYQVIILSRGKKENSGLKTYMQWDGKSLGEWENKVNGSDAIVNFTGKSVNCIYTEKNKKEIISSRLDSVNIIDEVVKKATNPPKVIVQAGSLAIYGNTTNLCDENSPHGNGFSVNVCEQWEEAFFKEELEKTRKTMFRIGFVLGENGGALEPLMKLTNYYLGGTIGNGKQYISWLHIEDLNQMMLEAIENEHYKGVYNATGDHPVTNKEFMKTLREVMNKPWTPPAPSLLVKIGAYVVMKADPGLALTGRKCVSKRLKTEGFTFKYNDLKETLYSIIHKKDL